MSRFHFFPAPRRRPHCTIRNIRSGLRLLGTLALAMAFGCRADPAIARDGDALLSATPDRVGRMTIVSNGRATATIVTTSDSEQTRLAVKDLQHYIEKISGGRLPVSDDPAVSGNVILVGRMAAVEALVPDLDDRDLGADGFVIKLFADQLVLAGQSDGFIHPSLGRFRGHTDAGTPNAVYAFLEGLGCRWYMPGDDGEFVPRQATITVSNLDVTSKPDFDGRWIGIYTRTGKPYEDFLRWRARNRISHNTYFHMHNLSPAQFPDAASHPEYFALVNGKRSTGSAAAVCFSNPEVVDILSGNLIDIITKQPPPWRSYTLGQADGAADGWCQCDGCVALYGDEKFLYPTSQQARVVGRGPSDTPVYNAANGYLTMANTIAERAEKVNPDVRLTYYALYNIPGRPTVKPRDSVLPIVCHLAPDHEHWRRDALHWAAISKHLYYYTYMGYRLDVPRFDIVDDIRWCHANKGIAMFLENDAFTPVNTLAMYLASRVLWDTDIDAPQVLEQFYANYFGAGAAPMKKFFETFNHLTAGVDSGYDLVLRYPDAMDTAVVAACRDHITEARRLARQPVVVRRIDAMGRYWRATELHVACQDAMARWQQDKTEANMRTTRDAYAKAIAYISEVEGEFAIQGRIALLNHEGYNEDLAAMNAWERHLRNDAP